MLGGGADEDEDETPSTLCTPAKPNANKSIVKKMSAAEEDLLIMVIDNNERMTQRQPPIQERTRERHALHSPSRSA